MYGKEKEVAEYILRDANKLMGAGNYKLSNEIPDKLNDSLTTVACIKKILNNSWNLEIPPMSHSVW